MTAALSEASESTSRGKVKRKKVRFADNLITEFLIPATDNRWSDCSVEEEQREVCETQMKEKEMNEMEKEDNNMNVKEKRYPTTPEKGAQEEMENEKHVKCDYDDDDDDDWYRMKNREDKVDDIPYKVPYYPPTCMPRLDWPSSIAKLDKENTMLQGNEDHCAFYDGKRLHLCDDFKLFSPLLTHLLKNIHVDMPPPNRKPDEHVCDDFIDDDDDEINQARGYGASGGTNGNSNKQDHSEHGNCTERGSSTTAKQGSSGGPVSGVVGGGSSGAGGGSGGDGGDDRKKPDEKNLPADRLGDVDEERDDEDLTVEDVVDIDEKDDLTEKTADLTEKSAGPEERTEISAGPGERTEQSAGPEERTEKSACPGERTESMDRRDNQPVDERYRNLAGGDHFPIKKQAPSGAIDDGRAECAGIISPGLNDLGGTQSPTLGQGDPGLPLSLENIPDRSFAVNSFDSGINTLTDDSQLTSPDEKLNMLKVEQKQNFGATPEMGTEFIVAEVRGQQYASPHVALKQAKIDTLGEKLQHMSVVEKPANVTVLAHAMMDAFGQKPQPEPVMNRAEFTIAFAQGTNSHKFEPVSVVDKPTKRVQTDYLREELGDTGDHSTESLNIQEKSLTPSMRHEIEHEDDKKNQAFVETPTPNDPADPVQETHPVRSPMASAAVMETHSNPEIFSYVDDNLPSMPAGKILLQTDSELTNSESTLNPDSQEHDEDSITEDELTYQRPTTVSEAESALDSELYQQPINLDMTVSEVESAMDPEGIDLKGPGDYVGMVGGAVGGEVGGLVGSEVGGAFGGEVGGAVGGAVRGEIEDEDQMSMFKLSEPSLNIGRGIKVTEGGATAEVTRSSSSYQHKSSEPNSFYTGTWRRIQDSYRPTHGGTRPKSKAYFNAVTSQASTDQWYGMPPTSDGEVLPSGDEGVHHNPWLVQKLISVPVMAYGSTRDIEDFARRVRNLRGLDQRSVGFILDERRESLRINTGRYQYGEDWTTVKSLGSGGQGSVTMAIDRISKFRFAVKQVYRPKFRMNEVSIMGRIRHHPGVVKLYGLIATEDYVYILMELLEGPSLRELIQTRHDDGDSLTLYEALFIIKQVFEILCLLEQDKILHDDIKSDNLVFRGTPSSTEHNEPPTWQLVLVDFGMAHENPPKDKTEGTPAYYSTEKAMGRGHSYPAEVFAAMITFMHMILSHVPQEGRYTGFQFLYQRGIGNVPLDELPQNLPLQIDAFVRAGLRKDPAQRATVEQLLTHPAMRLLETERPDDEMFIQHLPTPEQSLGSLIVPRLDILLRPDTDDEDEQMDTDDHMHTDQDTDAMDANPVAIATDGTIGRSASEAVESMNVPWAEMVAMRPPQAEMVAMRLPQAEMIVVKEHQEDLTETVIPVQVHEATGITPNTAAQPDTTLDIGESCEWTWCDKL